MQFSTPPEPPAVEEPFMTKSQMVLMGQYALLIVALLIVAILVVRPTITLMLGAMSTRLPPEPLPAMASSGPLAQSAIDLGGGGEATIDIKSVQGRVRESTVKKVNEIIDQHPEETLNVVRGWMAESGTGIKNPHEES